MNPKNILQNLTYHAVYDESVLDALKYAKDNGFRGIQLALEMPHFSFEKIAKNERCVIKDFVTKNNLTLSLHSLDETASLFQPYTAIRQGVLQFYQALFDFAEDVGAYLVTNHIGQPISFSVDKSSTQKTGQSDFNLLAEIFRDGLDTLVNLNRGRFLFCVENNKLTAQVRALIQPYLERGEVFLCWDIAKTYQKDSLQIDSELEKYFVDNIKYVRNVHLHDIDQTGKTHRVVGTGIVDFPLFFRHLSRADVKEYCFEVRPREKARESLENLKRIIIKGA